MDWFLKKLVGIPEQMWFPDQQQHRPKDRIHQTIDALRTNGISYLWDIVQRQDWDIFVERAGDLPPCILITGDIPIDWPTPRGCLIIRYQSEMLIHSQTLKKMMARRLIPDVSAYESITNDFIFAFAPQDIHSGETAKNRDPGRLAWVKRAHDMGLLTRACYSTPQIEITAIKAPQHPNGYQMDLSTVPIRYFDQPKSRETMMRTQESVQSLMEHSRSAGFFVLLDSEFDQDRCGTLGLRHLIGMATGRPILAVTCPAVKSAMDRWQIKTLSQSPAPAGLWPRVGCPRAPPPERRRIALSKVLRTTYIPIIVG